MNAIFNKSLLKTASSIWQITVKSSHKLVGPLLKVVPLISGSSALSFVKASFVFARWASRIYKDQGPRGLALRLKASSLFIMKALSEDGVSDSKAFGPKVARNNSGMPRWLPAQMRARIRQGDRGVIRYALGLCTLYRVLEFRGKLSLSTVTDPGKLISNDFIVSWIEFSNQSFVPWLIESFKIKLPKYQVDDEDVDALRAKGLSGWIFPDFRGRLLPLMKSGPHSSRGSPNYANCIRDIMTWIRTPGQGNLLTRFAMLCDSLHLVFDGHTTAGIYLDRDVMRVPEEQTIPNLDHKLVGLEGPSVWGLGKIAVKEEPGKLRLFAMVDSITQALLFPLHSYLFDKVLKKIPQDGTHNQHRPVKELAASLKAKGHSHCWSFDLSAATDRLPLRIQDLLLQAFTSPEFGQAWAWLIADRYFGVPKIFRRTFGASFPSYVKYAVGQPMGAYSSWAMLALTHHCIVQFAARRAGWTCWFPDYAVLGDDIVIGDHGVAREYLTVMDQLGVSINKSKSLRSKNLSMEFAKRFYYKGEDVTPFPLVGLSVGWLGLGFVPEVINSIGNLIGKTPSLYSVARYLGIGYKASCALASKRLRKMTSRQSSLLLGLSYPGAPYGVKSLFDWFVMTGYNRCSTLVPEGYSALWTAFMGRLLNKEAVTYMARIGACRKSIDLGIVYASPPKGQPKAVPVLDTQLPDRCRSVWPDFDRWWKDRIQDPIVDPFIAQWSEISGKIQRTRATGYRDEASLESILKMWESLDRALSAFPTSYLKRKDHQVFTRFPVRIRLWRKVQKVNHKWISGS